MLANLVEYPAVPLGKARFRMQAMATHTTQQAQQAAGIIGDAVRFATSLFGNDAHSGAANGRQVELSRRPRVTPGAAAARPRLLIFRRDQRRCCSQAAHA